MKTPTPEQLRLAAEIIETGCEWEVASNLESSIEPHFHAPRTSNKIEFYLTDGDWIIRKKPWQLSRHIPGFRPLEPNEQWHRDNFTEEMLPDGWRPLLKGEKITFEEGNDELLCDWEVNKSDFVKRFHWQRSYKGAPDTPDTDFWRTRRPLPPIKKLVPLEPSDVPPGSVIRRITDRNAYWNMVAAINIDGVKTSKDNFGSWHNLMNEYEILRPGSTTWEPCFKLEL